MANEYQYKRVLLKLSGEALAGDLGYGIDPKVVDSLADEIADLEDTLARPQRIRRIIIDELTDVPALWAAVTSSAAFRARRRAWIARRPTTSACSPRS